MCGLAAHDKPRVTRLAQGFQDNLTGLNSSQTLLMLVRGGGGGRGGGGRMSLDFSCVHDPPSLAFIGSQFSWVYLLYSIPPPIP